MSAARPPEGALTGAACEGTPPGNAQAWQAAGVRHELLMRVLPVLRHDMAGPLSVARMGNTVLKRYLMAQPLDTAQCQTRIAQNDEQLGQLVSAIRALNRWDVESGERAAPAALWSMALDIARPALEMHGLRLQPEGAAPPADWPELVPARALYAALGALNYLQDGATAPSAISIQPSGDGLLLQASPTPDPSPEEPRPSGARPLRIDAASLACLAEDLEWPVEIREASVLLRRPPQ
ncbi:hypothetical protein [Xylophilus sp. ASV27]|uniref:hypothetical protein n=1 Tax=Xylophilus sp. ASV27 TaxID=2795129 RepID=UPI0018EBCFBF|nr:hypothetical protein [Xylophilus sp. ASV27]